MIRFVVAAVFAIGLGLMSGAMASSQAARPGAGEATCPAAQTQGFARAPAPLSCDESFEPVTLRTAR